MGVKALDMAALIVYHKVSVSNAKLFFVLSFQRKKPHPQTGLFLCLVSLDFWLATYSPSTAIISHTD